MKLLNEKQVKIICGAYIELYFGLHIPQEYYSQFEHFFDGSQAVTTESVMKVLNNIDKSKTYCYYIGWYDGWYEEN